MPLPPLRCNSSKPGLTLGTMPGLFGLWHESRSNLSDRGTLILHALCAAVGNRATPFLFGGARPLVLASPTAPDACTLSQFGIDHGPHLLHPSGRRRARESAYVISSPDGGDKPCNMISSSHSEEAAASSVSCRRLTTAEACAFASCSELS